MALRGFALAVIAFVAAPQQPSTDRDCPPPFREDFPAGQERALRPFLEDFLPADKESKDRGDVRPNVPTAPAEKTVATIADLMRAVNDPAGLRGSLSKSLEQKPLTVRQWERLRSAAALIAESGLWLERRTPSRGPRAHWQQQAQAYTKAAEAIIAAADKHDYAGARRGLQQLAMQCAACHAKHR